MAVEVLMKEYLYWIDAKADAGFLQEQNSDGKKLKALNYPFHYNTIHDLEPFLWITLWFLLYRVPAKPSKPMSDMARNTQLDTAENMFSSPSGNGEPSTWRYSSIIGSRIGLYKALNDLPTDFRKENLDGVALKLAEHLVDHCYKKVEGYPNFIGAHSAELLDRKSVV